MNPTLLSSLVLSSLILIALADGPPMEDEEHPKMDCFPTTCGNVANITYPFWVEDKQPSHCGFPSFKISCENDVPTLQTQNQAFQVKEIFYNNQSLLLVNEDFASRDCPSLQWGVSFSLTPFNVSTVNRELVFLFNCSQSLPGYYEIPCPRTYAKLTHWGDDLGSLGTCQLRELVPVVDYLGVDVKDYLRVVKNGFLVEWTAADCSECRGSKGQCGYREDTHNFMCICPDGAHSRRCDQEYHRGRILIGVVSAAGVGFLVACLSLVLCFYRYRKVPNSFLRKKNLNNNQKIEAFLEEYGSVTPKRYSYSNVKKITKAFREKLGQGGFGTVFKGTLDNGHMVAVKILNDSKDDGEEFINEVASIGRTSHVNVVSLLGFCYEGSKRALIYDFMCNGSLEKLLYSEVPKATFDWERLYQIALGIARGLEYLHRGCNTRIVHFDIKPHNILLDGDFCPKISDFGLAKLCLKKESMISIAGARGTIGYIAPEVFSRNFGVVSSKSDVYSYGMVVLEIAGGRKNPNEGVENSSEKYFPDWIYAQLDQNGDLLTCGITAESEEIVRKMVLVGLWCIQTTPENRPSMGRVIEMMEGDVNDLQIPPKPYLSSTPLGSLVTASLMTDCSSPAHSSHP